MNRPAGSVEVVTQIVTQAMGPTTNPLISSALTARAVQRCPAERQCLRLLSADRWRW
jgi:hypothetical protein